MKKVHVKKIDIDDIALSRAIINKMTAILAVHFDYIVEPAPEVNFFMCDQSMSLNKIVFESVECEDRIIIDEENVILELDNGVCQHLFAYEGFGDLLKNIEADDMEELDPDVIEYLATKREYYKDLL